MTFSSDIIVGFPDETEEDFEKTLELIRTVRYAQLFTFIYSKRGGTRAAAMPDHVTHAQKTARMARMLEIQDGIVAELCSSLLGTSQRVLVEGPGREAGIMTGRLDNNMIVEFPCTDESLAGTFCTSAYRRRKRRSAERRAGGLNPSPPEKKGRNIYGKRCDYHVQGGCCAASEGDRVRHAGQRTQNERRGRGPAGADWRVQPCAH